MFESDGGVFRAVTKAGAPNYQASRVKLAELAATGRLVGLAEVSFDPSEFDDITVDYLLEHPRLAARSQPYEWSFSLLRDAALFHLDLHLDLLADGFTLTDATAYNVQFQGPKPVFIDHLSIRPYRAGEFWLGHRQFCEQFLNPLLLRAFFDVPHNAWYRGNLDGIPQTEFARLLPFARKLSWNVLTHIVLPARFQRGTTSDRDVTFTTANRQLPLAALRAMLQQLRAWIARLHPANTSPTTWAHYATTTTYSDEETNRKRAFVADFVSSVEPHTLLDIGCNTGDYSSLALQNGARQVIGFDFDQQALDSAHARAKAESLNFLPLYLDATNPSPDQGWAQCERSGFKSRFSADALLALAIEHHLAIARNVPLSQVVAWLVSMAPQGVIEFVPKNDPTVVKMLSLREDIFTEYTVEAFEAALAAQARVTRSEVISRVGRTLFSYAR